MHVHGLDNSQNPPSLREVVRLGLCCGPWDGWTGRWSIFPLNSSLLDLFSRNGRVTVSPAGGGAGAPGASGEGAPTTHVARRGGLAPLAWLAQLEKKKIKAMGHGTTSSMSFEGLVLVLVLFEACLWPQESGQDQNPLGPLLT